MLSIEKCNKILNKKKQKYSQEEIKQIRTTRTEVDTNRFLQKSK
jgi:hypothetical protein